MGLNRDDNSSLSPTSTIISPTSGTTPTTKAPTANRPWVKPTPVYPISGPKYVSETVITKPTYEQVKDYWSDLETVLTATSLPTVVLCFATDSEGTSSVLDFLKRFPVFSVDMSADVSPKDHRLVCIVASETRDIYKTAVPHVSKQPPMTLRKDKRQDSLTMCQLPWTCNYYFSGSPNFEPGQLSNNIRKKDHEDERERFSKRDDIRSDHGVPITYQWPGRPVPKIEQRNQQELARAEIEALKLLPADIIQVASKAKRILMLKESPNGTKWRVWSYLADPDGDFVKQYSWITRQSIKLQNINAAGAPFSGKAGHAGRGSGPQLTVSNGTIILCPPDKSKPLKQQNRVAVGHLSKADTETLLCWAPATVASQDGKSGDSVQTLLMSCIKCLPDVASMRGLMQANSVVLAAKGSDSGQADVQAGIPKPVDRYTLSRLDLQSSQTETLTVLAVWHDSDKPPGWRLFVQIQDIPDSLAPLLQSTGHKLRYAQDAQNTLLGAAQVYPLGYPSPSDSSKTINTIAEALQLAYDCKSYTDQIANGWERSSQFTAPRTSDESSASNFRRFSSKAIDKSHDTWASHKSTTVDVRIRVDLARDNDGLDVLESTVDSSDEEGDGAYYIGPMG